MKICHVALVVAWALALSCSDRGADSAIKLPFKEGEAVFSNADSTYAFDFDTGATLAPPFLYDPPQAEFSVGMGWLPTEKDTILTCFSIGTIPDFNVTRIETSSFEDVNQADLEGTEWWQGCDIDLSSVYVVRSRDSGIGLVKFTKIDAELPGVRDQNWTVTFKWRYYPEGQLP